MRTILTVFCASAALLTASHGVITYVDADLNNDPSSNTVVTGGAAVSPTNLGGWVDRGAGVHPNYATTDGNNFGNEGNTLQDTGSSASELTTTITGLNPSLSYEIYAFFWDAKTPGNNNWDIDAGLTSGSLASYKWDSANVTEINAAGLVTGLNVLGEGADDYTDFEDGNRTLYAANLNPGSPITGVSSVDVYIKSSALVGNQRTFYDGVGYEVIPEPSAGILGLLGAALMLRRRRK